MMTPSIYQLGHIIYLFLVKYIDLLLYIFISLRDGVSRVVYFYFLKRYAGVTQDFSFRVNVNTFEL